MTPAEAHPLTAAKRAELLQEYTAEMGSIREQLCGEAPLAPPLAPDAAKRPFSKGEVGVPQRCDGDGLPGAGASYSEGDFACLNPSLPGGLQNVVEASSDPCGCPTNGRPAIGSFSTCRPLLYI